ncbi:MAG TPA: DUF4381 domain-containing protein [Pseudomonadales bacterium]|nr:DUF4381 domain-containing protein [Pseudomonadales bacterium]HNC69432.1 DUF4381 domain-containing protein [Pseudomonadales bacterium]
MNAPDPLAGLQPIHFPAPIGWWPPAFGWWFLAALGTVALVLACVLAVRHRRRNRYRRAALGELEVLFASLHAHADPAAFAAAGNALLRRAALCRYPPAEIAALTGTDWLAFLDRSGRTDAFIHGPGRALADAPYDPACRYDASALYGVCRNWLRRHR